MGVGAIPRIFDGDPGARGRDLDNVAVRFVPEPGTAALVALGLVVLAARPQEDRTE